MVSHFDAILDILEGHNSAAELGLVGNSLSWWEDVLQDLNDSQSELRCKAFEDQMRVRLADSTSGAVWNVVSQYHVMKGE